VDGQPQGRLLPVPPRERSDYVPKPKSEHVPECLLTIDEAARRLNVPRSWLRDRVTAGQVPHTRLGRHVRFAPEHLAQIISEGELRAAAGRAVLLTTGRSRRRA
jgi:excisionase family DNA binding protein